MNDGFALPAAIEVVRLTARAEAPRRSLPTADAHAGVAHDRGMIAARRAPLGGKIVRIISRAELRAGGVAGPAIVEEPTATTVVPAGWRATVHGGALRLARN